MNKDSIIFVFGSNLAGRHRKGAALTAYLAHGAKYGEELGLHGSSYAIPTRDDKLVLLPIYQIKKYVDMFLNFAKLNPDTTFQVSRVGCEFEEYEDSQIAPLFDGAPENCRLPIGWRVLAEKNKPFTK